MTWAAIAALALAAFAVFAFILRAPRSTWHIVGAALFVGLAGYAVQGAPDRPGSPKTPAQGGRDDGTGAAAVAARQQMGGAGLAGDQHMIIADALARHGQFAEAAEVLRGAVERNPDNAEAWLAMGNALTGHAEGTISPAAIFAFGRAARAEPASPGPPFFLGLALLRSGRVGEGRAVWADLLARSPADAPWRGDLEQRLGQLDALIARQDETGALAEPPRAGPRE
ncbi:MAG: tetratricopeptide repeat protein [Pseudomonadota bacterium]